MVKMVLSLLLSFNFLVSKECTEYYSPNRFYETPNLLKDYLDENLNGIELFGDFSSYKKLNFKNFDNVYFNDFIKLGDYRFPKKRGIFSYKMKNKKIYEISFATTNIYKYNSIDIANEINNDFEGFWNDWLEDAYEMRLIPQEILFRYGKKYFSFSVFIYGVKGDATTLEGTVIKYLLRDYTKNVEACLKK